MRQQLEQERIDGERAKQILDNPVFRQAWKSAEDSIHAQMAEVGMRDTDMHTRLILAKQILGHVQKHIETVMDTGIMADMQLQEPNKFARMFGR